MRTDRPKRVLSLALAAMLLVSMSGGHAAAYDDFDDKPEGEPSGMAMAADALVARPLGLVAMVVGAVLFTVALPFEMMAGDVRTPAQKLVVEPARYTFQRRLGDI